MNKVTLTIMLGSLLLAALSLTGRAGARAASAPELSGGSRVYLILGGPSNLTGGPSAKGQTPGLATLEVLDGGQRGRRGSFVPMGDQTAASPNDPHTVVVRPIR